MIIEQFKGISLINGDCLEYMRGLPDNAFELAIVDPPYGIGADKNNAHRTIRDNPKWKESKWDTETPKKEYFTELFRISKNQIIWGGNYFLEYLYNTQCFLIWDKGVRDFSLADAEIAWTSFKSSVRIKTIHRAQLIKEKDKFHPTQKPIRLYKWLLDNYAKQGDKILDTHSGSLSIGIACDDYGFELTACEIDKEYYDNAKQRLLNHQAQTKMAF